MEKVSSETQLLVQFVVDSQNLVQKSKKNQKKRKPFGDASTDEFHGPWAPYINDEVVDDIVSVDIQVTLTDN